MSKSSFAIAVEAGLFQAQTITYNMRGESVVTPLSGWVKYREALAYAPAGYKPNRSTYRFLTA